MGSFWRHFGDKISIRKALSFRGRPRSERGSPRRPPQGQKAGFSLESCLKSRVDLLASGCLRELFWRPKWSQNGVKIDPKITKNAPRKSIGISTAKSVEQWSQNDSQKDPKWHQNCIKFQTCFRKVFLRVSCSRRPGHLGGRRRAGYLWHTGKTSKIKKSIDFVWEWCKFGNSAFWYPSKKLF